MTNSNIDKINWHDGNLSEVTYQINMDGVAEVKMLAYFYSDEDAHERDKYTINCYGVTKHNLILDSKELKDNVSAGNISNGYLKEKSLWVYFTDGVLVVVASKFEVTKC